MGDNSPLKVVAIGGGTGLSALLEGLKRYTTPHGNPPAPELDLTAVVTVTDDGGSSGRLRREFAALPPGDIRNCMVALSEDSALLSRLFQYRFQSGRGLKGHSFGNLFLMALTQIMGDFPEAVKASSEVLNIAGRIYPSTAANVALEATLANGSRVVGETKISRSRQKIRSVRLNPRKARPLEATLEALDEADVIAGLEVRCFPGLPHQVDEVYFHSLRLPDCGRYSLHQQIGNHAGEQRARPQRDYVRFR